MNFKVLYLILAKHYNISLTLGHTKISQSPCLPLLPQQTERHSTTGWLHLATCLEKRDDWGWTDAIIRPQQGFSLPFSFLFSWGFFFFFWSFSDVFFLSVYHIDCLDFKPYGLIKCVKTFTLPASVFSSVKGLTHCLAHGKFDKC